jgi:hypothetical protein
MLLCSEHLVLAQDKTDSKRIVTAIDSNNLIIMANSIYQSINLDYLSDYSNDCISEVIER